MLVSMNSQEGRATMCKILCLSYIFLTGYNIFLM
jgi:hypothetical protein